MEKEREEKSSRELCPSIASLLAHSLLDRATHIQAESSLQSLSHMPIISENTSMDTDGSETFYSPRCLSIRSTEQSRLITTGCHDKITQWVAQAGEMLSSLTFLETWSLKSRWHGQKFYFPLRFSTLVFR